MMKISEIAEISRIMAKFGITEFNAQDGDVSVQLKRDIVHQGQPIVAAMPMPIMQQQQMPVSQPIAVQEVVAPVVEKVETIDAPIVGTFYSSPGPDQPKFVKVGDIVDANKIVCIVEAMKVMNEIKAGKAGKIVKILANDGKPVEYGEPLFEIA